MLFRSHLSDGKGKEQETDSCIFITEGDSASGSITKSRDVYPIMAAALNLPMGVAP